MGDSNKSIEATRAEHKKRQEQMEKLWAGEAVPCWKCGKGYIREIAPGWKVHHGFRCDNCDLYIEVCGPSMETMEKWEREREKAIGILTEWAKEATRCSRIFCADYWITESPDCFKFAPCCPNGEKWREGHNIFVTKDKGEIKFERPDDGGKEWKISKTPVHIEIGPFWLKYKNWYRVDEEKHCYVLEDGVPEQARKSFEKWNGLYDLTDGKRKSLTMAQKMQSIRDLGIASDVWDGQKILCEECGKGYYQPIMSGKWHRCKCEHCGYEVIPGPISEVSIDCSGLEHRPPQKVSVANKNRKLSIEHKALLTYIEAFRGTLEYPEDVYMRGAEVGATRVCIAISAASVEKMYRIRRFYMYHDKKVKISLGDRITFGKRKGDRKR